jgi:WG repeat protein
MSASVVAVTAASSTSSGVVVPFVATHHMLDRGAARFGIVLAVGVAALLIAVTAGAVATGQAPASPPVDPIPFQKNVPGDKKLWGYADATGRLVVPAQFDVAHRFGPEGLAEIKRGGRWGMIDRDGREVIAAKFTYQVAAHDGRVGVCVDDGREIPGVSVLGPNPGQRSAVQGTICGYLDRQGAVAIPFSFNWVHPFAEGVAPVSVSKTSTRCRAVDLGRATLYGLVDTSGKLVVQLEACYIGPADNGWIRVVYEEPSMSVQHIGFLDPQGRVLLAQMPYDSVGEHWDEDRLPVRNGNRWGFIDRQGQLVVPIRYEDVEAFSEGRARLLLNGKWGFTDPAGQLVIPFTYDDAGDFSEGLACVKVGDHIGFIDLMGKMVIDPRFDWDRCSWPFREGLRPAAQGGKWGYIDRTGRFVIAPKFDEVWGFSEGFAAIRQGALWGFVDRSGAVAVPPKYFRIDNGFINGFAYVTVRISNPCCPGLFKFSEGFINKDGREFFDTP